MQVSHQDLIDENDGNQNGRNQHPNWQITEIISVFLFEGRG